MERLQNLEQQVRTQQDHFEARTTEILRATATRDQRLDNLADQVQQLTAALVQLTAAATPAPVEPVPPPPAQPVATEPLSEPRVGTPERYGGEPEGCSPFVTNCSILFALQPHTFATEKAKVAFAINQLTGRARLWGTAEWERQTPACVSFNAFSAELQKVFGPVSRGPDAAGGLLGLKQGTRSVVDYAIEFRIQARQSEWNHPAQIDAFLLGLADYIKDELVSYELPRSLDGVIALVTRLDQRIQGRRRGRQQGFPGRQRFQPRGRRWEAASSSQEDREEEPEPMQVGGTRRGAAEQQRRQRRGLCLYCGGAGHFVKDCPVKGRTHQ